MDQTTQLLALVAAAAIGILATLGILRRQRHETEAGRQSQYAVSTEGMKRCPNCGFGNLVTDRDCSSCGRRLPG